jgi:hypothetical protein
MYKLKSWVDPDKINWVWLSANQSPGAIELLIQNQDRINWNYLSHNPSPGAIELLTQNQELINWGYLSANPNAIDLLSKNQDHIDWYELSQNPSIFELDYQAIKEHMDPLKKEIYCYHPSRINLNFFKEL